METQRHHPLLTALEWLFRLVLAAVFFYASIPKLLHTADFAKAIENYHVVLPLIGKGYINLAAGFLPAVEFTTALALLWNHLKRGGSLMAIALLTLFLILIAQAIARGLNIDCGCFGSGATSKLMARTVGVHALLEDVVWLGMAVFVYVWARGQKRAATV
jgi:putative oxidoreductase